MKRDQMVYHLYHGFDKTGMRNSIHCTERVLGFRYASVGIHQSIVYMPQASLIYPPINSTLLHVLVSICPRSNACSRCAQRQGGTTPSPKAQAPLDLNTTALPFLAFYCSVLHSVRAIFSTPEPTSGAADRAMGCATREALYNPPALPVPGLPDELPCREQLQEATGIISIGRQGRYELFSVVCHLRWLSHRGSGGKCLAKRKPGLAAQRTGLWSSRRMNRSECK